MMQSRRNLSRGSGGTPGGGGPLCIPTTLQRVRPSVSTQQLQFSKWDPDSKMGPRFYDQNTLGLFYYLVL